MQKILYSRKLWFSIILLVISFTSILVYSNISFLLNNWFDTLTILFGFIGIISTAYHHWSKFNLLLTKLWVILSNSSSIWNVSANFEGEFDEESFRQMIEELRKKGNVSEFITISDTVVRIVIDGLNYLFEYVDIESENGIDTRGKILCTISDFTSTYDSSISILEDSIIPYFRIIENNCQPSDKIFNFKVEFKEKNPFINLIVKNVDVKSINNLWYSINEETKVGKRSIKISKKAIECTTSDITDFQKSSTNYISLVGD